MKRKYFLRGLGAGIVLSAAVMGVTSSKADLTDEEIRKRALELGMIEKPDALESILKETKNPYVTTGAAMKTTNNFQVNASTGFPTVIPTKTSKPVGTQSSIKPVSTQKSVFTPKPEITKKPEITSNPVKKTSVPEKEYIEVTILGGMWSDEIAQTFERLELVDDAKAFDNYLCDNNYASLIRVGSYEIPKGATYEEIAKIITK